MDKLKYIKLEQPDGSYSDSIPLAVDSDYVDVNGDTLTNELGKKATIENVNNLQAQINGLTSGSPYVASSISEMTNTNRIYVNTTDGHWYWNNGTTWVDGGVYQATEVSEDSIADTKLKNSYFLSDYDNWSVLTLKTDGVSNWMSNKLYSPGFVKSIYLKVDSETDITGTITILKKEITGYYSIYLTKTFTGHGNVTVNINKLFDFEFIVAHKVNKLNFAQSPTGYEYNSASGFHEISTGVYSPNFTSSYAFAIGVNYTGIKSSMIEVLKYIDDLAKIRQLLIFQNGNNLYPIIFDFINSKVILDFYCLNTFDKKSNNLIPVPVNQEINFTPQNEGTVYILLYNLKSNNFKVIYTNLDSFKYSNILEELNESFIVCYFYNYGYSTYNIGSVNSDFIKIIKYNSSLNTDVTSADDLVIPKFGAKSIITNAIIYNPLYNKKINFLGDSIVKGENSANNYKRMVDDNIASIAKEKLGLKVARNYGIGGSRITTHSDSNFQNKGMVDRYEDLSSDADINVLWGGTNDFGNDVPMGDLTNLADTTKFKPAFYKLVYGLMAHFPNTKLLVITPIHRDDSHPDATPNGQGLTLKDYRDAEIEICEKLGIPYLDMYTKLGFSPLSYNIKSLYMPDGIHPNSDGMRRLGDTIIHALTEL